MNAAGNPYYRADLAFVHHRGFGFYGDGIAPGILELLEPVRTRGGEVLEIGCGSGHLTRHLVGAGHRVTATDASPAMLDLLRAAVPDVRDVRRLVLPDDPLPQVDAVVSAGHPLNYLANEAAIDRALIAIAGALRPGGVMAVDLCDLRWGEARRNQPNLGWTGDDWAIVSQFSVPAPNRYVREMVTFVKDDAGAWRRDEERHDNILVDTSHARGLLAQHGVDASLHTAIGEYELPEGLFTIVGHRR